MDRRPFHRLRNIDADDLEFLDKVLRIGAVVIAICAVPPLLWAFAMGVGDPPTLRPQAKHDAMAFLRNTVGVDVLGIVSWPSSHGPSGRYRGGSSLAFCYSAFPPTTPHWASAESSG